jgi:hypothetical protein
MWELPSWANRSWMRWLLDTNLDLYKNERNAEKITILPVLRALEQLETRVTELGERLARN